MTEQWIVSRKKKNGRAVVHLAEEKQMTGLGQQCA
jgi:hypothetical protein